MAHNFMQRLNLGLNRSVVSKRRFLPRSLPWPNHVLQTTPRIIMSTDAPGFQRVEHSMLIEEETLPGYKVEHYYPARIGQVFNQRYQTIGKLGYGSASTVWLCRDLSTPESYVALKVYINCSKVHRELPIYDHINSLQSAHHGRAHVRKLIDSFAIEGPHGKHTCLVHKPLGLSFGEIRAGGLDDMISAAFVRELFQWIISGLEFLHEEAHVIHTDLQPNNLLMGVRDNTAFELFERQEEEYPVPRKELIDRTIYISRQLKFTGGPAAITDLSEGRRGECVHTDLIMPSRYRAPEVIWRLEWSYPVDMWALGMAIWDLFEGTPLLRATNRDGQYSEQYHLAQLVAILGPPPLDFIQKSQRSQDFWDNDANSKIWDWICDVPIPDINLETAEHRLEGDEKQLFLTYMRKMLQWKPEDRGTCDDLYRDEWLLADLIKAGIVEATLDDE